MVDVPEVAAEPESLGADLTSRVIEIRDAYYAERETAAGARRKLDADIAAAKIAIEQDDRGFHPDSSFLRRMTETWNKYGQLGKLPAPPVLPQSLDQAGELWSACAQCCAQELRDYQNDHGNWEQRRRGVFGNRPDEPRLSSRFQNAWLTLREISRRYEALRAEFVQRKGDEAAAKLTAEFDAEEKARMERLDQLLRSDIASLRSGVEMLGGSGQDWPMCLAGSVALPASPREAVRLGSITSGLPEPYDFVAPCMISFPSRRGLALEAGVRARDSALELLRSVVLRVLLEVSPGQLRLSLIDPVAMGQTFSDFIHLGDYDDRLIDTGVKTSASAIERCMAEQTAHLETVISKYLRGQFADIMDYNRHAGEMTEAYRLIVIADYPRQFSDRAAEQLLSLVDNGPRCGVYTLLLYSPVDEAPRGIPFVRLTRKMDVVRYDGRQAELRLDLLEKIEFRPDACPPIAFDAAGRPITPAAEFVAALGGAAKQATETIVTLDTFLPAVNSNRAGVLPDFLPDAAPISLVPASWWSATTTDSAVAPLGRSGAQGIASMFFSSTAIAGGAIIVGLPRSGKTTCLHSMIVMMALLYSPQELEFYLIDAKHGVEFKAYERLPHARMVSVNSEREFSLAVLRNVQQKIRERAELIKAHGAGFSNITEYRQATGEVLPRIVMVIDEFHELFEEADTTGLEAFAAFSDIVRMGSFCGVHVVVASQTLAAMPAMDRQTLTLLPQRVAFACNEYDAEIVMGDANKAPRLLAKTGEGLFNPARGDESRNQLFQGLYINPDQRGLLVRELRAKADQQGWTARPRVFDGDAVVPRPPFVRMPRQGARFTVPIGEPFTLADAESVVLPRARGSNLLVIGDRDDDPAPDYSLRGVLHSCLAAARTQGAFATVVDFIGDEDVGRGLPVMEVAGETGAKYVRSAQLEQVIADYAATVDSRVAAGDYRSPTQLLVLFGLQRALSLMPYDSYGPVDADEPSLSQQLSGIALNGPEVGVHIVIDTDQVQSAERRLGAEIVAEFTLRVAGSTTDQRDLGLITGSYGTVTAPRYGQLVIGDLLKGTARRLRGYELFITPPDMPGKETSDV